MPILLKEVYLAGPIKPEGSVTVKVDGAQAHGFKDLWDVVHYLEEKVIAPILKKLTDEEKKKITHDPIFPSTNASKGDIHVLTGMFPPKYGPLILGGISHFLKAKHVLTDDWDTNGKSVGTPEFGYIIPVRDLTESVPPVITMSGGAVEKIKQLLGMYDKHDAGHSFTFSIDANELYNYIAHFKEASYMGMAPKIPNAKIRAYLNQMLDMTVWAGLNGYKNIIAVYT